MPDGIRVRLGALLHRVATAFGYAESPRRYTVLRRNMVLFMVVVSVVPLFLMAVINYQEFEKALKPEMIRPLASLVSKTKHSVELFLAERISTVSFVASAYSFDELANQQMLQQIFQVMRQEFGGFVDLGLIDSAGLQVSYVGPYELQGKNYQGQDWFHEVSVRGIHVSDVFMGYRKFPHLVIAVKHVTEAGQSWVLRSTIDTEKFDSLIASTGLDPATDAFIVNRQGVLQTPSRFYGRVLDRFPLALPPVSYEPSVLDMVDPEGREIVLAYSYFTSPSFVLVVVKPRSEVLKSWHALRSEIIFVFAASVVVIFVVVFTLTDRMVKRIEEADQSREQAHREIEHQNKLASIGRLASGVAHEINNPMAIISEKAGLMEDLIEARQEFPDKDKFLQLTDSILRSVDRCSTITHRLLSFARRMDVKFQVVNLNEVVVEVLGFLEKEALHRNIEVVLELDKDLPEIESDPGQLQQVFLNILNNAFLALGNGGRVLISSRVREPDMVEVSIQDNGIGMSEETKKHLFEPFFTTRKEYGTGLGLSITYGIVTKLGGGIEVESEEGKGATFTVFLPRAARERGENGAWKG
jgi:two-component system, NtrC family, sensor kinase